MGISQLEIVTFVFAIVRVLTSKSWYKPKDVGTAILVKVKEGRAFPVLPKRPYDGLWAVLTSQKEQKILKGTCFFGNRDIHEITQYSNRVPNDNTPVYEAPIKNHAIYLLTVYGSVIGALHALAWENSFPSYAEK